LQVAIGERIAKRRARGVYIGHFVFEPEPK